MFTGKGRDMVPKELVTNLGAASLLKKELAGIVENEEGEGAVKGRGPVHHLVTVSLGSLHSVM